MFVYGGSDIREGTLNSLWSFDLTEISGDLQDTSTENNVLEWKEIRTHGSVPS